ncbi:FliG C-terminal domain-containing protein [Desulfohalovibrio reitneri]|uniref:FliG C-terminal domain-containing protein n=1 Tax=Desulfohalovibrio reitneri TaxID=1307759 RepID=UPI00068B4014|nr:FliG C-terminal domain-containing protein [Desulfohalovibrio reitneri]
MPGKPKPRTYWMPRAHYSGGTEAVAAVVSRLPGVERREALDALAREDPDLAGEVRSRLFTFEDLVRLAPRDLAVVARESDPGDLPLALRGTDGETARALLSGLSQRALSMVLEETEAMGPQPAGEVEAARSRLAELARRLGDEGRISLGGADGEEWVGWSRVSELVPGPLGGFLLFGLGKGLAVPVVLRGGDVVK